jgi:hypothetical protein
MDLKELYLKKSQFASRQVGEEMILVPLKSNVSDMNELFTLNEVGSFIWDQINENSTLEDIINAVLLEFDVDINTARKDVEQFLQKLSSYSLRK